MLLLISCPHLKMRASPASFPGIAVRTSPRPWAPHGHSHTAYSEVGNCLPLEDGKPSYREQLPKETKGSAQTRADRNTQPPPERLSSHLLKLYSREPAMFLKFKLKENLGHLRWCLTPRETPSVSEVLKFSTSPPFPQCAWGQGRGGDVYTGQGCGY